MSSFLGTVNVIELIWKENAKKIFLTDIRPLINVLAILSARIEYFVPGNLQKADAKYLEKCFGLTEVEINVGSYVKIMSCENKKIVVDLGFQRISATEYIPKYIMNFPAGENEKITIPLSYSESKIFINHMFHNYINVCLRSEYFCYLQSWKQNPRGLLELIAKECASILEKNQMSIMILAETLHSIFVEIKSCSEYNSNKAKLSSKTIEIIKQNFPYQMIDVNLLEMFFVCGILTHNFNLNVKSFEVEYNKFLLKYKINQPLK